MGDDELLDRFRAGDGEAFGALLTRYRGPLYNFALRTLRDPEAASDVLQDTFTRVIQRADTFDKRSKFSTWMYTVARNLCIDHMRKQKHRRHASLDAPAAGHSDGGAPLAERVAAGDPGVDRRAEAPALRERIAAAVEALPDEQREVFLLRQLQQMPFAQIAEVTGAPENTIKSRMRYALERLQQALADYEEDARAEA
ncbi:MAG: RNA polymerase sigma factor [Myxococcales bacterium]|jgi:RNA polymerase sigma-70 factor (ECF subfamily)